MVIKYADKPQWLALTQSKAKERSKKGKGNLFIEEMLCTKETHTIDEFLWPH